MLLFAGVFVFLILYSMLQGEGAIDALTILVGTPMEANNAFEWSDKLLAVGIALAGSFTTVTIALSTFAVQKESEEAKSREALLADRALHQNVLDAVENLFRFADDKLVQISTLAFDLEDGVRKPADDEWREVRSHQQAFWDSVDSASRITTGNLTISELWSSHYTRFNVKADSPHDRDSSFTEAFLRGTGMFGKPELTFDHVVKCLQSARADVNFEPMLWHYLARTLPDRYAISEKIIISELKESDASINADQSHNLGGEAITVPSDFLSRVSPDLANEVAHINKLYNNVEELLEKNKFFRELTETYNFGPYDTDSDIEDEKNSILTELRSVDSVFTKISKITNASADFVETVQERVKALSGISFPGSSEFARSRHTKEGDAWLAQLHVELAGMILVPDMLFICCKTDSGKWSVNVGLAFLLDLVRMYTASFDSEFTKLGRRNRRMSIPPLTPGFFTKSYLEDSKLLEVALLRTQGFRPNGSEVAVRETGKFHTWSSIGGELKLPELGGNPVLEEVDDTNSFRNLPDEVRAKIVGKIKQIQKISLELKELKENQKIKDAKAAKERKAEIQKLMGDHARTQNETKRKYEISLRKRKMASPQTNQIDVLSSISSEISSFAEVSSRHHRFSKVMAEVLADIEQIITSTQDTDVSAVADAFLRGSAADDSNGILSVEADLRRILEKKIFNYPSEIVPTLTQNASSKDEVKRSLKNIENLQDQYSDLIDGAKQKLHALKASQKPVKEFNFENPFE